MSAVIPPAAMRASDAEREETVARLHRALGEGRLDLAETETRVAAAYATTHRADLAPLLADLPDDAADVHTGTPGEPPVWSVVWAHAVWRARMTLLGPGGAYPTPAQCRTAAVLTAVAMVWMTLCAVIGAAVVAV